MKKRLEKRLDNSLVEKEAKKSRKKAQSMQLPFGMIFSILLIALFIVVAFIAIRHFISLKKCAEINLFIDTLQNRINEAWGGHEDYGKFPENGSISGLLPYGIEYVCFYSNPQNKKGEYKDLKLRGGYTDELFFYPGKSSCRTSADIKHVNITEIVRQKNPYCFENKEGVFMQIEKGFNDNFVKIK